MNKHYFGPNRMLTERQVGLLFLAAGRRYGLATELDARRAGKVQQVTSTASLRRLRARKQARYLTRVNSDL